MGKRNKTKQNLSNSKDSNDKIQEVLNNLNSDIDILANIGSENITEMTEAMPNYGYRTEEEIEESKIRGDQFLIGYFGISIALLGAFVYYKYYHSN